MTRPKRYGEPIYAYYRDSERPGIVAIRTVLEGWFIEVPEGERLDIQQRFRSPIERQHWSAVDCGDFCGDPWRELAVSEREPAVTELPTKSS